MKLILPVGDQLPASVYLVVKRGRKSYEIIGKAASYPHDNPIWTNEMKTSREWWIVVAPYVDQAIKLAKDWPAKTSLPSGARILNHGVNK